MTAELIFHTCFCLLHLFTVMEDNDVTISKSAATHRLYGQFFLRARKTTKKPFVSGAGATRHHIITEPQRGEVIISQ